ncbi:MAG: efflux RND transporter permease subunit, partial [Lentisphaerae bacterium]|nr:efflux RND transporter permease subunit [Lentisphaerota bacterium]
MNIVRFSVERPVFVTMTVLSVIILGLISLSRLPIDLMPDISYPVLSITTTYENAGPEEVEELITRPIERALSAVPGVDEVASVSSEGSSNVRIMFTWGTELDTAANDVRDRLDRVIRSLPDDATRPSLRKFDPSSFPILMLGAASNLDPIQMRRIIEDDVQYRIERVEGVASLDIWGGLTREIHVDLDPEKLKFLGLSSAQIVGRIRTANVILPAGTIEEGNYDLTIRTKGEFVDLEQLNDTTIAVRNGVAIKLKDVAEVNDSWERVRRIVRINGQNGIRLSVSKQSGANTVDVAERVLKELKLINEDLPQLSIIPLMDSSKYIKDSISNVGSSALYGALFAVIILLIFLRNIRSTLIISVSIPTSIVATFALIYFGGFTLNIITLGGLALGVGMLVDNSIVVLENIFRYREEEKLGKRDAATKGAGEVTNAIIASTLTTVAIFMPLVFIRGMAGIVFKQLASVVSFSLLCSLIVALTLIPMLSSKYLYTMEEVKYNRRVLAFFRITEHYFRALERGYKKLLHNALDHRPIVLITAILLLIGSILLMPLIGTELMPQGDEGEVRVSAEMDVGTKLGTLDRIMQQVEQIITDEVHECESMVASIGGTGRGSSSHIGEMRLSLVAQSERKRSSEEISAVLRKKLANIPGAVVRVRAGQGMFMMRRMAGGSERIEVEVRGYDLETSGELARRVKNLMEPVQGITDVQITRDIGAPERLIEVDREKAELMKVAVHDVAETLQTVLSGARAGYFRESGQEYLIRVKVKDSETLPLNDILDVTVQNTEGKQIVLRNVVKVSERAGPVEIERKNQERVIPVRANVSDRDVGSIIKDVRTNLETLPAPRGFSVLLTGDYEEQVKTFKELALALILALILIYMVMACLYESLRDPFIVMFSVP